MTISCRTCAVEYAEPLPDVCPICADERQYVPATGQAWTTGEELRAAGTRIAVADHGGYWGLTAEPQVGIGQTAMLVPTPDGALLWDPPGYLDDASVAFAREHGVRWIAASHPHMFGAQLDWSAALGDATVLVNAADAGWLGRRGPAIEEWSGELRLADELVLRQLGGHFPGSAVAHWAAGQGGAGVLFAGDTIAPNPDRRTVTFMRSFPNRLPLSAAVVERIAARVADLRYDTIWHNFGGAVSGGADRAVQESAQRYAAWVRGDHDDLT
ncbi:hypothetical protein GGQ54_002808 [Naumannella cuiyingiana]|uniref:Metallo-beta-lactamase domain-containing protein n=1 Tax=Naumannella cuiyingiana TaxID=1347891 RepID=A0A7Z0DB56_9ACTN|nr:MBL fold metallo-hydrolase [Naumannella cuiyingiana]NYI72248.1 hypothetical protein [Naumannella cuiyingiana]